MILYMFPLISGNSKRSVVCSPRCQVTASWLISNVVIVLSTVHGTLLPYTNALYPTTVPPDPGVTRDFHIAPSK